MEQSNEKYNDAFTNVPTSATEHEIEGIDDWRNEHGQPDFEFLQSLCADGSIEALNKLRSIAEDLDVEHDHDTPPDVLVARILSTVAGNADEGPQLTP